MNKSTQIEKTVTDSGKAPSVISEGTGAYGQPCDKAPRGKHSFRDISSKPGRDKGERLVTSQCKYCDGLIVDVPTISAF